MSTRKIVIIGPESTGKSTLCTQLAGHYATTWCPEYARQYLQENGNSYSFDDLLAIAKGQLSLEDSYQPAVAAGLTPDLASGSRQPAPIMHPLLFIDTDMYVMKVWCEFVFDQCHPWILNKIVERKYDLYLLCKPDLPWVKDALREYPDLKSREKLYHMYKDILVNQPVPWAEISGGYEERLQKAIAAADKLV